MTAQPDWMEVEPLPEATLNDARAARAYLLGRAEGHSTATAESDRRGMASERRAIAQRKLPTHG